LRLPCLGDRKSRPYEWSSKLDRYKSGK